MAMLGSPHRVGNSNIVNSVNTSTQVEAGLFVAYDGAALAPATAGEPIGVSNTPVAMASAQAVTHAGMMVAVQTDVATDLIIAGQPAYLDASTAKVINTGDDTARIGTFSKSGTTTGKMLLTPNEGDDAACAYVDFNLIGGK